jgi:iron complex outermembrane recepter protein
MKFRNRLISSAIAAALGSVGPAVVCAQDAGPQSTTGQTKKKEAVELEEIVVTGIRASLQSAQQIKRDADTVVDSIVAEDIGKLPDVTATEALQRITGIQIGRDLGEGGGSVSIGGSAVNSGIEIRGLPQVEATLNGREVFTATGSRVFNFEDVPSNLLAGIDVYKDPTANLVGGGIGGTVDLRTRKPFDFAGLELEASAAERYADLSGLIKPEVTALASDHWHTDAGELGALLSFAYQDRGYREIFSSQNGYNTSTAIVPGQTVLVPNGTFNTLSNGERKRIGVDAVLQWQPASDLLFSGEYSTQDLTTSQDQFTFYSVGNFAASNPPNLVPGSVAVFPGTLNGSSATYANALVYDYNDFRQVTDLNRQFALNGKWTPGNLTLIGDASYTRASETLVNPTLAPLATVPSLSQSITLAGIPVTTVTGADLTNLATYGSALYTDNQNHYDGDEKAFKLDASYDLGDGFFKSVAGGVRYADRTLDFVALRTNGGSVTAAALQAAAQQFNPPLFGPMPFGAFFHESQSTPVQPPALAVNMWQLQHNLPAVEQALGVAGKTTVAPASDYNAQEKNTAAYLRIDFKADIGIPMDGNLGVRLVRNADYLTGFAAVFSGKTLVGFNPIAYSSSRNDPLPSLNLRFKLTDDLQARIGASKVITYPDFSQLAPSYNLLATSQSATGGNPYLRPTKANQVDGTLEWYFARSSSVYGAVFYKKVQDFVFNNIQQGVVINGLTYNLTVPQNGGNGSIRGLELGYQQFFDFLPGWWSGLGVQATYTYVDAIAPTAVEGVTTTLPGLSKNSYNLVGMYEKGPISARLAYNWRSQFYQSVYSGATAKLAANPIFYQQYGWLDASLTYDVSHQWSVYAQGSNLLRTRLHTFYGAPTLPQTYTIDDRQYVVGFRFKF